MARDDDRLDKPGSPGFRISTLTAFIAVDAADDSEGVVGVSGLGPLIGADDARIMQLRPVAQKAADAAGVEIKLARFTIREDIDTLHPAGS